MTSFVRALACMLSLMSGVIAAQAQDLQPGKPIRFIVGLSAGGGTDVTARLIAQKMSASMGMNVIVENKAGGNFIPATREVATSPADGHTLYFISTSSIITQALHADFPYDMTKFVPITEVCTGPLILVAKNSLGAKSVKDVIDLAKKSPGTVKFGSGGGTGSSLYLATILLRARTGIDINIVPYKGAAPALTDLLGGHIDAMFDAMPAMAPQAKEGKVTPLAVTGAKRSPALPNVQTMQEAGLDYLITGWYGILAPPGTPPAIAQRLRDEVAKALGPKDVIDTLAGQGMEPRGTQPAEWGKYLQAELAFYSKIIKDAGVKP